MSTQFNCQKTFLFQAIHFSQAILIQAIQFSVSAVSMLRTVLFQTIQFSISMQFSSIWPVNRTLLGATTPSQNGPGNDDSEGVLCKAPALLESHHQIFLVSCPGHSLSGVLPLCRDAVGVFCSKKSLGKKSLLYIYIYIYIYVCVCVCMCVCVVVCVRAHARVCILCALQKVCVFLMGRSNWNFFPQHPMRSTFYEIGSKTPEGISFQRILRKLEHYLIF